MEMRLPAILGLALTALATCRVSCAAPNPEPLPKTLCGITAGKSVDKDVVRRYGKGLFAPDEDHGGGRYFVDPKKRMTLHTTIGVDNLIFRVECSAGVKLPTKSRTSVKQATTTRLVVPKVLSGKLRFGASPTSVMREFGKRNSSLLVVRTKELHYTKHSKDEGLNYEVDFHFVDDKLVTVSIYNGE